jgi:hypothetical protein
MAFSFQFNDVAGQDFQSLSRRSALRWAIFSLSQQGGIFEHFEISGNILRMLFLDPAAQERWADWDAFARFVVGTVRRTVGPGIDDDPVTMALISDVSAKRVTRSLCCGTATR